MMNVVPVFWAFALALLAVTVVVIVWPLLRRTSAAAPSEDAARAAVYRDQKRQLDDDLATGALDEAAHTSALAELAQRLGIELDAPEIPPSTAMPRGRFIAALAAVAIIPIGAIGLYVAVGTPEALRPGVAARERPSDQEIVAMVESLAAKMQANPADPKGWRLLGRSYAALGRYDDSAKAYAEATRRGGDDADVLADWAESLALARNQVISGEPEALARRALAMNDRHPKALALLATGALERGDFDTSVALWRRLYEQFPPASQDAARTLAAIGEVERLRADAAKGTAASAPSKNGSATASASAAMITGSVELAPALAARVAAGDTVYIFARAADGPRRPLAVQRVPAGRWPLAFRLDDTMGMAGGPALSSVTSVIVEARISHSGNATPQPGDLSGRTGPLAPGARNVKVVVDGVVP